eukprot:TRINITY_DN8517_c0_g1_i1.p1 TRINITY_DN8517_c0_g1~~TRINITY_DN8517_c0_g1_i1.p1  ORF type:complete len:155 (-),score=18.15 TRINITY_DN8517_c0_g1_i1:81-524(-)
MRSARLGARLVSSRYFRRGLRTRVVNKKPTLRRPKKDAVSVTKAAEERLREIIRITEGKAEGGVRLSVKERGCSGMSYTLDVVKDGEPNDEVVSLPDGINIFVDPRALLYVVGTEMDYVDTDTASEFLFSNPNVSGMCGCGESFSIT